MRRLEKFGAWMKDYFSGWRITRVDAAVFLLLLIAGCLLAGRGLWKNMVRGENLLSGVHRIETEEAVYAKGRVYIDINTAGVDALMSLPGIGEELARRIVNYREENGPFASVDDLMRIDGIGEAKVEKIRGRAIAKQ